MFFARAFVVIFCLASVGARTSASFVSDPNPDLDLDPTKVQPNGGTVGTTSATSLGGVWVSSAASFNVFSSPQTSEAGYRLACLSSGCPWTAATLAFVDESDGILQVTYDNGNTNKGLLSASDGEVVVSWSSGTYWTLSMGPLSGLWQSKPSTAGSRSIGDYLVLSQLYSSSTTWTVLCVDTFGPCSWPSGSGDISGTNVSVSVQKTFPVTMHGVLSSDSQNITWPASDLVWERRPSQSLPLPIHTVHTVFMNHLDVGYNGIPITGFVNNVLNTYFNEYFPRAIEIANGMRDLGGTDRFIYTTHPWLVSMYLDCPPDLVLSGIKLDCPGPEAVSNFTEAVNRGDITWHAGPMNLQLENMEPSLVRDSIRIAHDLDAQFHQPPKTCLSQRDVPFMTRSAVPLLRAAGVEAITVGTNYACEYPKVPKIFLWKDENSGTDIIAMEHPHGYGGISKADCVTTTDGYALCFAFRTDNSGPPLSTAEVIHDLNTIRAEYPSASVFASTYDAFVEDALRTRDSLPVYTEEAGDTWIYGVPSDAKKQAQYREISRARAECFASGACSHTDPGMANFTRLLVKLPEHTWGLPNIGTGDEMNWSNQLFEEARPSKPYQNSQSSWREQRAFLDLSVEALELAGHPLAQEIRSRLDAIEPAIPDLAGLIPVNNLTAPLDFKTSGVQVSLGKSGAFRSFLDTQTGLNWAAEDSPLGLFVYQSLNDTDFNEFANDYMLGHACLQGFCKPGSNYYTTAARRFPSLTAAWRSPSAATVDRLVLKLTFPIELVALFGAPSYAYVNATFSRAKSSESPFPPPAAADPGPCASSSGLTADIDLLFFNKTATRLPESLTYAFHPSPGGKAGSGTWTMDKLGLPVSPTNVISGGAQYQHAVWSGVQYKSAGGSCLVIDSMDAAVVQPTLSTQLPGGQPLPAPVTPLPAQPVGMAFALSNNVWDTNYVFWYPFEEDPSESNARFRFSLKV